MNEHPRHPDILTATEAVGYLRLDAVAPSPEAAIRTLERLRAEGRIRPLRWCKEFLYAKPDLDQFVARELAALNGDCEVESDPGTDANLRE